MACKMGACKMGAVGARPDFGPWRGLSGPPTSHAPTGAVVFREGHVFVLCSRLDV